MNEGTIEIHWGGDFTADSMDRVEGALDFYFDPGDLTCDPHMVWAQCTREEFEEIEHTLSEMEWPMPGGAPTAYWIPYKERQMAGYDDKDPKPALRHVFQRATQDLYEVRETLRLQDFRFHRDRIAAGDLIGAAWGPDSFRTRAFHRVMDHYERMVHVSCKDALDRVDTLRQELDIMLDVVNSNDWRGAE